jgi:hypothetical protein
MAVVRAGQQMEAPMPHARSKSAKADGNSAEAGLPPPGTRHWVARHKAQVVEAIQSGRLSLDEALRRYRLSVEEFGAWKRALYRFGVQGLRADRAGFGRVRRRTRRASASGGAGHG